MGGIKNFIILIYLGCLSQKEPNCSKNPCLFLFKMFLCSVTARHTEDLGSGLLSKFLFIYVSVVSHYVLMI